MPKLSDDTALSFKQDNPKKSGSKAYERYELYKAAKIFKEAIDLGATKADVDHDVKKGFCAVDGAAAAGPAVKVAPSAAPAAAPAAAKELLIAAPPLVGAAAVPLAVPAVAAGQKRALSPHRDGEPAKRRVIDLAPDDPPIATEPPGGAASGGVASAGGGGADRLRSLLGRDSAPVLAGPAAAVVASPALVASPASAAVQMCATTPASSSSVVAKPTVPSVDLSFAKLDGKPMKFIKRVSGEAKRLLGNQEEGTSLGYKFHLKDRDNLSIWGVQLTDLNPDGSLAKGLAKNKLEASIDLEISLPDGFPMEPPFARVVYPQLTGGYVFHHGGICFEPLTAKGWVPSMTMPALAIAIKGILDYGEVRVAGVGDRKTRTVPHYTEEGARKDHKVIVSAHRGGESSSYGSLKNYKS